MHSMFLSLLNWKSQEDLRYTLLTSQGPFELRLYQRLLSAKVVVDGNYDEALKKGQDILNDYAEGNNFKVDKIINFGPCYQEKLRDSWEISFNLPSNYTKTTLPFPINRIVRIEEIAPVKTGVLRFNGEPTIETFLRRGEELKKWLTTKGWVAKDNLRILRSDSTIPVSFLRSNEVHIDVI
jgi:hypothetical protein